MLSVIKLDSVNMAVIRNRTIHKFKLFISLLTFIDLMVGNLSIP